MLSGQALAGKAGVEPQRIAAEASVDDALRAVVAVDRKLGADLDFTEAGLARRQRAGATAAELERAWEGLKQRRSTLRPEASDAEHEGIVVTANTMIRHAFQTSKLVVDPDSDAFYVAFVMTTQLSLLASDGGRALGAGLMAIDRKPPSVADRLTLAELDALIGTNLGLTVTRIQSAINEDANFHGESPSLQSRVPRGAQALRGGREGVPRPDPHPGPVRRRTDHGRCLPERRAEVPRLPRHVLVGPRRGARQAFLCPAVGRDPQAGGHARDHGGRPSAWPSRWSGWSRPA
jgi:hypothetical protein